MRSDRARLDNKQVVLWGIGRNDTVFLWDYSTFHFQVPSQYVQYFALGIQILL